jgi:hypothetical protein
MVYVIEKIEPIYSTRTIVAIFNNEGEALDTREKLEEEMMATEDDRGQYHKITCYQINKIYPAS